MPQTYPSFDEAVEHQQRWGSPPVGDQLENIASTTASIPWNALMSGPKFMQSYAAGEIPPEKAGPEAFKTMLGYMGMGSALSGEQAANEYVLNALKLSKPVDKFYNPRTGMTTYHHDILDDTKPQVGSVGTTSLAHDPRREHIHVQSIDAAEEAHLPINHPAAMANSSSQVFGPSNMKTLLRSLQEHYPYARSIGGDRVSGARWLGARSVDDDIPMKTWVKLPETPQRKADRLYQEEQWQKKYGGKE